MASFGGDAGCPGRRRRACSRGRGSTGLPNSSAPTSIAEGCKTYPASSFRTLRCPAPIFPRLEVLSPFKLDRRTRRLGLGLGTAPPSGTRTSRSIPTDSPRRPASPKHPSLPLGRLSTTTGNAATFAGLCETMGFQIRSNKPTIKAETSCI